MPIVLKSPCDYSITITAVLPAGTRLSWGTWPVDPTNCWSSDVVKVNFLLSFHGSSLAMVVMLIEELLCVGKMINHLV